jgi:DNA polymerase I
MAQGVADSWCCNVVQATGIDLSAECPVGHGRVTCWSVYGGPDIDFASDSLQREEGMSPACVLYIDTYLNGRPQDLPEVVAIWDAMREFLEGDHYPKVLLILLPTHIAA